jgi:hypothetical protein
LLLQAWTFNNRAAIVIGVTEHMAAVQDRVKLTRLQQLLTRLVEKTGDNVAVSVEQVHVTGGVGGAKLQVDLQET